jgi:hypothetical protein
MKTKDNKSKTQWLKYGLDFKIANSKDGKQLLIFFEDGTALGLDSKKLLRRISICILTEAKLKKAA